MMAYHIYCQHVESCPVHPEVLPSITFLLFVVVLCLLKGRPSAFLQIYQSLDFDIKISIYKDSCCVCASAMHSVFNWSGRKFGLSSMAGMPEMLRTVSRFWPVTSTARRVAVDEKCYGMIGGRAQGLWALEFGLKARSQQNDNNNSITYLIYFFLFSFAGRFGEKRCGWYFEWFQDGKNSKTRS